MKRGGNSMRIVLQVMNRPMLSPSRPMASRSASAPINVASTGGNLDGNRLKNRYNGTGTEKDLFFQSRSPDAAVAYSSNDSQLIAITSYGGCWVVDADILRYVTSKQLRRSSHVGRTAGHGRTGLSGNIGGRKAVFSARSMLRRKTFGTKSARLGPRDRESDFPLRRSHGSRREDDVPVRRYSPVD